MRLIGNDRVRVTVELDREQWDRLVAYVSRRNAERNAVHGRDTILTPEAVIESAAGRRIDEVEPRGGAG